VAHPHTRKEIVMSDHTSPSKPAIKQEQPIDTKGAALASPSATSSAPAAVISEEERRLRNEEAVNTLLSSRIDDDEEVVPLLSASAATTKPTAPLAQTGLISDPPHGPSASSACPAEFDAGFMGEVPIEFIEPATSKEIPWAMKPYSADSREAEALTRNLRETGQKDPILVYRREDGRLIAVDGRNRLLRAREMGWKSVRAHIASKEEAYELAKSTYINRDMNEVALSVFIFQMSELLTGEVARKKHYIGKNKCEKTSNMLERDFGWTNCFGSKNVQKYIECGEFFDHFPDLATEGRFTECGSINALRAAVEKFNVACKNGEIGDNGNSNDGRKGVAATVNRSSSALLSKIGESEAEIRGTPLCAYHLMCLHQAVSKMMTDQTFLASVEKGRIEYNADAKRAKKKIEG